MAADHEAPQRSAVDLPGRRHADVDEPLFDPDLIPNAGDPRSVGELLRDCDLQARQLLMDVTGDDAAGMLRAWPPVVDGAAQLWHALPRRLSDDVRRQDVGQPMTRLRVLTEGFVDKLRSTGWPGDGPVDDRLHQLATTLGRAGSLVHRYGAEISAERGDVHRDIEAARTRMMHTVYLSAHAIGVALHQRSHDIRATAATTSRPIPLSTSRSPYLVGSTGPWARRIGSHERTIGRYLAPRFSEQAVGEATPDTDDPHRLRRALASWDVQAHRTLATNPSPANLVLATATQANIGHTTVAMLRAAHAQAPSSSDQIDRLDDLDILEAGNRAWSDLASRWRDLCSNTDPLDAGLARAAGEVRAAYSELTHTTNRHDLDMITTRSELDPAIAASLEALQVASELAHVVSEHADNPDLTGPARSLSRRAHNVTEAVGNAAGEQRETDTVWVTPQEISANRTVPLPAPVADGLRAASSRVIDQSATTSSYAGAQNTVVLEARPVPRPPTIHQAASFAPPR